MSDDSNLAKFDPNSVNSQIEERLTGLGPSLLQNALENQKRRMAQAVTERVRLLIQDKLDQERHMRACQGRLDHINAQITAIGENRFKIDPLTAEIEFF